MSRAPGQFAPSWLPRHLRRNIARQLRKLSRHDVCSVCGSRFRHNSRTAGGLDAQGNVVLAGECCIGRVAATFVMGFYSDRQFDFLWPLGTGADIKPTNEQIADAIAVYQNALAETDKCFDGIVQCMGDVPVALKVNLLDYPWKEDDRDWFERNQKRSHRARMPFPGEVDKEAAKTSARHALIMLVRQVEPGSRMRGAVHVSADLLPVGDNEAAAHALFEVAMQREPVPPDGEALDALIRKYTVHGSQAGDV